MLSFATEFPVGPENGSLEFLNAIQEWVLGSPHTHFIASDFSSLYETEEWSARKSNEKIDVLRLATDGEDSAAIRYTRTESDLEWVTNVVFSRTSSDAWVGVRVSCESDHPSTRVPVAKKPIVVRTLLNKLVGADDGKLRVSRTPHILTNNDIGLAAQLILGTAGCYLPVVYVSSGFDGQHAVNSNSLAENLSGMAHVVVEPNRPFSLRLKIEVNSQNVYGGAIGIYWPDGAGRRQYIMGRGLGNQQEVRNAVVEEITLALTNRRPLTRCTWSAVQEAASRRAFAALKTAGSKEVDDYVRQFDKELKAKEEHLADAEREIGRLKAEIRKYEARESAGSGLTLRTGNEQDFYIDEIKEITLDALRDAVKRVHLGGRRHHILTEILENNTARGEASRKRELLKNVLRDYRSMDARTKKILQEFGFLIEEDGKHYKLVFQGDGRYTFSLPKTGSDHRGGLNIFSDISKQLL